MAVEEVDIVDVCDDGVEVFSVGADVVVVIASVVVFDVETVIMVDVDVVVVTSVVVVLVVSIVMGSSLKKKSISL